jgi:DNA-binding transcriptional MerR regulator
VSETYYRMRQLAPLLGETQATLRYWEDAFGLTIARLPSGQRLYTPRMVERLREIQRLLRVEGHTVAGAKRKLRGA